MNQNCIKIQILTAYIQSVWSAGWLDMQGTSEEVLSQRTLWDPPANWWSLIRWWPDPVSQCYEIEFYRSVILLCSVLCLYGSCEIQFRAKSFHLWLLWGKKNSHKSRRKEFCLTTCMSGDIISKLVKKVRTHKILIDRKPLKRNHVFLLLFIILYCM
jgi:hypothetical protein